MIGEDIGVENYIPPEDVHGVIANPVCTQFSTANYHNPRNMSQALFLVKHCLRIIESSNPKWWVLENPATGKLKDFLGKANNTYQPYEYGSPYTKRTALWGNFKMPKSIFNWTNVPKNPNLYARPNRKPSLAFLHKSSIKFMPEFEWCKEKIKTDADLRSLCSYGFACAFKESNP